MNPYPAPHYKEGINIFKEIERTISKNEVHSSYQVDALTVHLISHFSDKGSLLDAMYAITLQRLRKGDSGLVEKEAV